MTRSKTAMSNALQPANTHQQQHQQQQLTSNDKDDKVSLSNSSTSDSDSGYSTNGFPTSTTTTTASDESNQSASNSTADQFELRPAPRSVTMPLLPASVRCIVCPVCRVTHFLDDRGAASLPKNMMLRSIADKYRSDSNVGRHRSKAVSAAYRATATVKPFATATTTAATATSQLQRTVSDVKNMPPPPPPTKATPKCQMCEKSPTPVASVRCNQCNVNYCFTCLDNYHPSRGPLATHALTPLTKAAIKRSSSTRGLRGQKPDVPARAGSGSLPRNAAAAAARPVVSSGSGQPTACARHPTESTSLYCSTCQVSMCVQCDDDGRTKHHMHDLKPIGITFKIQKVCFVVVIFK